MAPGCHCRVQKTWCHCWVLSWGAIVVCYGWGEGDGELWGNGYGAITGCCRVITKLGGVDVALLGAIAGCQREGNDPNLGSGCDAITGCHCWVPLQGSRGEGDQLWGSGGGVIAGCHIRVPL